MKLTPGTPEFHISALTCGCDATANHFCDRHRFDSPTSSNIEDACYNVSTKEMRVHFRRRDGAPSMPYVYSGVTVTDWDAFRDAESKGAFFSSVLRDKYVGVKLS